MKKHLASLSGLAIFALTASVLEAATFTLPVGDYGLNMAQAYDSGTAFATGDTFGSLAIGNINHLHTNQLGLIKFDISSFNISDFESASIEANVEYYFDQTPDSRFPVQTINVYSLNYDLGANAFTASDITTTDVTHIGSFNISGTGTFSFDVSSAFTSTLTSGYDYLSLRFENASIAVGTDGYPVLISIQKESALLEVQAIPEPSSYALIGAALATGLLRKRSRSTVSLKG